MNDRQRFLNVMKFGSFDRLPIQEIGVWEQTLQKWYTEGLSRNDVNNILFLEGSEYFGLDRREYVKIDSTRPFPVMDIKVIEENERFCVYIDDLGVRRKALKEGTVNGMSLSMDQFLDFPVKDRKSFIAWKKGFENPFEQRYPENWSKLVEKWRDRDYPICLLDNGQFGFYSMLRTWAGTEEISCLFYDEPELVHEMLEFLTEYLIGLTEKALKEVDIDYFNYSEDMCFNKGPLVSPSIFKEFFMPCYKKVNEHLNKYGVDIIVMDCDGKVDELIPLLLDCGITGIWPLEVTAGMDPVRLRKQYGKALCMSGGIDKTILAGSKKEIEEEVKRKILPFISEGGYIPTVDHLVHPDVTLDNFTYYMEIKRKAIEGKL